MEIKHESKYMNKNNWKSIKTYAINKSIERLNIYQAWLIL